MISGIGISPEQLSNNQFYRASGCPNCFQTGYKGRIGIFEIIRFDSVLSNLILKTWDSNQIKQQALENGMVTLRQDGIRKVLKGITTIEEILRITQK
jgi:general secretion pathway protein E